MILMSAAMIYHDRSHLVTYCYQETYENVGTGILRNTFEVLENFFPGVGPKTKSFCFKLKVLACPLESYRFARDNNSHDFKKNT